MPTTDIQTCTIIITYLPYFLETTLLLFLSCEWVTRYYPDHLTWATLHRAVMQEVGMNLVTVACCQCWNPVWKAEQEIGLSVGWVVRELAHLKNLFLNAVEVVHSQLGLQGVFLLPILRWLQQLLYLILPQMILYSLYNWQPFLEAHLHFCFGSYLVTLLCKLPKSS